MQADATKFFACLSLGILHVTGFTSRDCMVVKICINCRSVKIASLEVAVGDIVVIAAADDEADEDAEPPLGLLQAIWQTAKGQLQLLG